MKILGITGGVGAGKSQVLAYMRDEYSAYICQMDEVARLLQKKGGSCYEDIILSFGNGILEENGEIDRKILAGIVFGDPRKLERLNRIVHPAVLDEVKKDILEKESAGVRLYVLESALLPDAGGDLCDELWYIYASEKVRRERLRKSRGYSDEKITRMIESQPSEEYLRQVCGTVIDNSGTFEETKKQIGDKLKL